MTTGDTVYRYTDDPGCKESYTLRSYIVERTTAKTAVIRESFGDFSAVITHRIHLNAHRPYAHTTPQAAAEAYYRRKQYQLSILESQVFSTKCRLAAIGPQVGAVEDKFKLMR